MIIIVCAFLGCIIGVTLTTKYKKRYLFYKELNEFFSFVKHSISFSQKLLGDITLEFFENRKKNLFNYQNYLDFLNSKSLKSCFDMEDCDFLKNEEKKDVVEYFNQLGKLNLKEEVEKIQTIISAISICKEEKQADFKKYSNIFIKLGLLFGLGIGIILI